jgi:hypothetical protein
LIFDTFKADRETIESEFGGQLEWHRVDGRKRCFIGVTLRDGGYREPEERWPAIQEAMINSMLRLERTFRPRVQALRHVV